MNVDLARLRRYAPAGVAVIVLLGGWLFVAAPVVSRNTQLSTEVSALRERLAGVRASVSTPAPAPPGVDAASVFVKQVASGDASSSVVQQLAALAKEARAANLLIETGERVALAGTTGPRVADGVQPDPRFRLFDTPLAYSPVSISFDGEYAGVGDLLWRLRDLPTTIEIRNLEIKPVTAGASAGRVHVALTLFAYARPVAQGTGAMP